MTPSYIAPKWRTFLELSASSRIFRFRMNANWLNKDSGVKGEVSVPSQYQANDALDRYARILQGSSATQGIRALGRAHPDNFHPLAGNPQRL
jgi:hypothetical protein